MGNPSQTIVSLLPCGITQCYLPPLPYPTQVNASRLNPEPGYRLTHTNSGLYETHRPVERGKGGSFPGPRPRDIWGAPPSLKNTENGVPDGLFLT